MTKFKLAILSAIPMLWAGVALAQVPPTTGAGGPPPTGHHQQINRAEWHSKMCTERYAHMSGHLGYLEAKLDLTEQQRPAFNKWRQALLDAANKARSTCLAAAPKGDTPPTVLERETMMETMLSARLATLQATKPALQALYDSLTPAQRAVFDRPHGGGHRGPGMMGGHGMMGDHGMDGGGH